jgi:fibronectin type 3 domain-containing protein
VRVLMGIRLTHQRRLDMTLQSMRKIFKILAVILPIVAIGGCGADSLPSAPTGLTISSTVSQNMLTWNSVVGCTYYIYRGTAAGTETLIATSIAPVYNDTPPVSSSTPYYYIVTAVDSDNNESPGSNEVSVTPPVLTLGTVTAASVALSWTTPASTTGITGYNIYRSTTSGSEALPVLASSTTTSYTDASVANNGTTYYYRVTAVGANGETLGSNEVLAAP